MDERDRSQLELLRIEMSGKLDRLGDAMAAATRAQEVANDANEKFKTDHEKRMRSLERWKFAIPASILMMAAVYFGGRLG